MEIFKSVITVFLLFFITGCNSDIKEDITMKSKIESYKDIAKEIKTDSLFVFKEKIVLKVPNENIMSSLKQLCITDGHFIISDNRGVQLLVFDRLGNMKKSIGRNGSGPGEFESLTSIAVNSDNQILTLDVNNMRVTYFTIDGNYLKSFNIRQGFNMAVNPEGGLYTYNTGQPRGDSVKVIDYYSENGKLEKNFCPSFFEIPAIGGSLINTNGNGELFFVHPSVYKIVKYTCCPSALLEFGAVPRHYKKPEMKQGRLPSIQELNEATALNAVFANNKYVLVNMMSVEPKNNWLDIYDTNGNILMSGLKIDTELKLAALDEENMIYFIKYPKIKNTADDFELSDYEIVKYKFLEN